MFRTFLFRWKIPSPPKIEIVTEFKVLIFRFNIERMQIESNENKQKKKKVKTFVLKPKTGKFMSKNISNKHKHCKAVQNDKKIKESNKTERRLSVA